MVGLGPPDKFSLEKIRKASGKTATFLRDLGIKKFATTLHMFDGSTLSPQNQAQALVEGSLLGTYQFTELKTQNLEKIKTLEEFTVLDVDPNKVEAITTGLKIGEIIATAVNLTRNLVSHPGNSMTPTKLAETAKQMVESLGLDFRVLSMPEIEALGMGAFIGVAKGSQEPAKFIIVEYNGKKEDLDTIVIVGKGITFDSGGISIKSREGMELLKTDMAGAAAVLGIIQAVAQLGLPIHLVVLAPATENLPSGTALKPGDVLKSLSGRTIEIISTDSEGRLILADALEYAARYKPAAVLDLATLTGACVVALGEQCSGLFGNDLELLEKVRKAGETSGERVWELPLWPEYAKQIKSDIADVKNSGGRPAGAITGAAFLQTFVKYPWCHLDIAGTAWTKKTKPYTPKGATGVGVRLLTQFLRDWVEY